VLERYMRIVTEGWACWAYSNHDVVRHKSRWNLGDGAYRVYAALLMSLRGSVCLYQGEELGLTEAYVPYEDLQDPYGKRFWPKFKGRDGCRTPMPWIADNASGGFTDGHPWLPVAVEHLRGAVSEQERDDRSVLQFYRAMIAFRKAHSPLQKGEMEILHAEPGRIDFIRRHDGVEVFCAFNLSGAAQALNLPEGEWRIDRGAPFELVSTARGEQLPPYQACFAVRQGQ